MHGEGRVLFHQSQAVINNWYDKLDSHMIAGHIGGTGNHPGRLKNWVLNAKSEEKSKELITNSLKIRRI